MVKMLNLKERDWVTHNHHIYPSTRLSEMSYDVNHRIEVKVIFAVVKQLKQLQTQGRYSFGIKTQSVKFMAVLKKVRNVSSKCKHWGLNPVGASKFVLTVSPFLSSSLFHFYLIPLQYLQ